MVVSEDRGYTRWSWGPERTRVREKSVTRCLLASPVVVARALQHLNQEIPRCQFWAWGALARTWVPPRAHSAARPSPCVTSRLIHPGPGVRRGSRATPAHAMAGAVCRDATAAFPPPAPPPDGESHDYVLWGIVMCEVAVTFIALGANIQRLGLTQILPSRKCGCLRCVLAERVETHSQRNSLDTPVHAPTPAASSTSSGFAACSLTSLGTSSSLRHSLSRPRRSARRCSRRWW